VVIAGLIGLAISVGAIFGGIYKQTAPFNLVWVVTVAWIVLGLLMTIVARGRRPASQVLADLRATEAPSSM
jgi:predicted MFS family arabinose efflux permease